VPTVIEIRNFQPGGVASSNIVLEGRLGAYNSADLADENGVTIENPIGTTIIDDQRGSILVSSSASLPFLLLRTNILTLNADGGAVHVVILNAFASYLISPLFAAPPRDPREDEDKTPQRTGTGYYNRHYRQVGTETDAAYSELGAFGGDRSVIASDYNFSDIR